jgi:hypothetical protein
MSLPVSSIISGGLALEGNGAIKPTFILDCADLCGTAGQVLSSTGTALEWISSSAPSAATPTVAGIVLGCTSLADSAALGCNALVSLTTGTENVALGPESLRSITTGSTNVAVGSYALYCSETAELNVALGYAAGYCATGSSNTLIGAGAGETLTTGECNVALGYNVQLPDPAGSNQLAIGRESNVYWLTGDSTLAIKPGAGVIDCANSCGAPGQVLTSTGSNALQWATPAASATVIYNRLIDVTASTAASVIGWEGERSGGSSYLNSGNTSAMLFISANSDVYGVIPVAWAQIMIVSNGAVGLSQVIASNTSGGTWSIAGVTYPAYSDTTVQFTSNTTGTPMLFNIALTQFGGFRSPVIVYGTAAT